MSGGTNTAKKILFLGASASQTPAIEYAKARGLYVITADYIPENPGHKLANECYNVSTVDKDKIFALASDLRIDAISAYASDPAAPTAAFVSERLGLIGTRFKAVETLSNKAMFRHFLSDNDFKTPWYITATELHQLQSQYRGGRAVLKPVDSSGSKGVFMISSSEDIDAHFETSVSFSRIGQVILEECIERKGPQIHGEGFLQNGKLVFLLLGDQIFSDVNPLVPYCTMVPSIFHKDIMDDVRNLVLAALHKVGFTTGGVNVEVIRDRNDDLYILEIGARNGGNFMPHLMKHATGFDLVRANVDSLISDQDLEVNSRFDDLECHYAQIILHSRKDGSFDGLNVPASVQGNLLEEILYYKKGDQLNRYRNSKDVVGVLITKACDDLSLTELLDHLSLNQWVVTK